MVAENEIKCAPRIQAHLGAIAVNDGEMYVQLIHHHISHTAKDTILTCVNSISGKMCLYLLCGSNDMSIKFLNWA